MWLTSPFGEIHYVYEIHRTRKKLKMTVVVNILQVDRAALNENGIYRMVFSFLLLQVYLILFIISKDEDSCKTIARCHFSNNKTVFKLSLPTYSFTDRSWSVLLLWFLGATCCYVCVYVRCCSIFKCFYFNSSVCLIHLFQQWQLNCHLFGKELLTRLIIGNSVVCQDMIVRLSLMFGMTFGF